MDWPSRLTLVSFAGMSTSATGLTYCFWSLANEPGIVAELRKELDELEVDERGVPSIRTVMNSPYLNGVVKEGELGEAFVSNLPTSKRHH